MRSPKVGDQELALLRYLTENAPVTLGQAMSNYGEANGLARSTLDTMIKRLSKKGYLTREIQGGVFHYSPTVAPSELMSGIVARFVEGTLGGSLLPFVNYFSRQNRLNEAELAELERLVEKLQSQKSEAEHE